MVWGIVIGLFVGSNVALLLFATLSAAGRNRSR